MTRPVLTIALRSERDVVAARQRTRQVARLLGFPAQDQTRLAIAVSEVARNAVQYASQGRLEFRLDLDGSPQQLVMRISDEGPGFASDANGLPVRSSGTGLASARRLVDRLEVETGGGRGTTVLMRKRLSRSRGSVLASELPGLAEALTRERVDDFAEEIHQQNRELVQALDELRSRQEDLERINRELEDTNRGVVALYAELDEKAEHLKRSDAMKTKFLSNMSHEFRTPLNAILAIARLLQEHADGDLEPEQDKQVAFIMKAAHELTDLVDDLLDLAKVEAGKIVLRRGRLDLANVFGALRGMMRPLLVNDRVRLLIEEPEGLPALHTDEAKVSQVLRNLLSNALKFTERGEVRMWGALSEDGTRVSVSVSDTGIGIDPADQLRIFEEFSQVEHAVQRRVKGTGLGLALSRRLAELLGGSLTVASTPGEGSVFTLTLPVLAADADEPVLRLAPGARLLMIDDDPASRYVVREIVAPLGLDFHEAPDGAAGLDSVRESRPSAIVLDLIMPGMGGVDVLRRLRADAATASLPVVIATSKVLDPGEAEQLAELRAVVVPKSELALPDAGSRLLRALARAADALAPARAMADVPGRQG